MIALLVAAHDPQPGLAASLKDFREVAEAATWSPLLLLGAAGSKEKCGRRRRRGSCVKAATCERWVRADSRLRIVARQLVTPVVAHPSALLSRRILARIFDGEDCWVLDSGSPGDGCLSCRSRWEVTVWGERQRMQ